MTDHLLSCFTCLYNVWLLWWECRSRLRWYDVYDIWYTCL